MPRAWVDGAWSALRPQFDKLPRGSRLSVIRIGTRPAVEFNGLTPSVAATHERPPRQRRLSDAGSAIGAALGQALTLVGPGEAGLVLLISDGDETLGRAEPVLRRLAAAGIPVRWWDPTEGRLVTDAAVRALTVQPRPGGCAALVELAANQRLTGDLVMELNGRTLQRRPVTLEPGQPLELEIGLGNLTPGHHRAIAEIEVVGDLLPGNNRRGAVLRVSGPSRVGLMTRTAGSSPVAVALAAGGWAVEVSEGGEFEPDRLAALGVLILDGITPDDLTEAAWSALTRVVSQGRTGLIVLGGPGTFGLGGYRHSTLERLLPVSAEAPERTPAAVVIFAIDTSGSMAQRTHLGTTRLELAQAAVAAAIRSLRTKDQIAVLGFDVASRVMVPLAGPVHGVRDLETVMFHRPAGGTRLAPAIDGVLDLYPKDISGQRLLVLVSDGQVTDPERADGLGRRLAAAGVRLSVLAVGDPGDGEPLRVLADGAGGHYQVVTDFAQLPVLMEAELERRLDPIMPGPLRPHVRTPLPLNSPPTHPWPEVLAYPVTRAREGAQVYLTAPNEDPLLAAHRVGAGRVLALPAGLGAWAPDWPAWPDWDNFLGGLVSWAAGNGEPLTARMDLQPDGSTRVQIDRLDEGGAWAPAVPLDLMIQDPWGRQDQGQAQPVAPGRAILDLVDASTGGYRILPAGNQSGGADLWYQPDLEFQPGGSIEGAAAGLLIPWTIGDGDLPLPRMMGQLPLPLVLSALLVFIGGLLFERLPVARPWLGQVAARINGPRSRKKEYLTINEPREGD
jgi:hypothetical protein